MRPHMRLQIEPQCKQLFTYWTLESPFSLARPYSVDQHVSSQLGFFVERLGADRTDVLRVSVGLQMLVQGTAVQEGLGTAEDFALVAAGGRGSFLLNQTGEGREVLEGSGGASFEP